MHAADLYSSYFNGLAVAAVIIVAAAVLLLMVRAAARRILRLATVALELVVQIKSHTNSIWGLEQTNEVVRSILDGARNIESHTHQVAEALHEQQQSQ